MRSYPTFRGRGQETITDAAFAHLAGIYSLDMSFCSRETITPAAIAHLRGIVWLNAHGCAPAVVAAAAALRARAA